MSTQDFLKLRCPLLDVRSPSEFNHGHIPGSHSFPLFTDDERAEVGTLYKKEGKNAAVKLGLSFVGPKLEAFIESAEKIAGPARAFGIYCWRGGMRSSSLAWLLETSGFKCTLLKGGYKSYRRFARELFNSAFPFVVIGGLTGSGKTELLQLLKAQNAQVIDLEEIASHRGSSFGHIGQPLQPTTEQFENLLAMQLSRCHLQDPIWIEDESRMIGTCSIPSEIWEKLNKAPLLWIQASKEIRLKRLLNDYGRYATDELALAVERMIKKLGAVRTKEIVHMVQNRDLVSAILAMLEYYDQTYVYSSQKRPRERIEVFRNDSNAECIEELIKIGYQLHRNS